MKALKGDGTSLLRGRAYKLVSTLLVGGLSFFAGRVGAIPFPSSVLIGEGDLECLIGDASSSLFARSMVLI